MRNESKRNISVLGLALTIASVLLGQCLIFPIPSAYAEDTCTQTVLDIEKAFQSMPSQWLPVLQENMNPSLANTDYVSRRVPNIPDTAGVSLNRAEHMAWRVFRGERSASDLLRLGARIQTRRGRADWMILPNYQTLCQRYNVIVDRWIADGLISESEVIRPAMVFRAVSRDNPNQLLFIRPGVDPWPDPSVYQMTSTVPQLANLAWQELMASGRMPFAPGGNVFLHDLSHLSELISDVEFMRAMRRYYNEMIARPESWRRAHNLGEAELPVRNHFLRNYWSGEAFSVPDIAREAEIRAAFPGLFAVNGPRNTRDAVARLELLEPGARASEIRNVITMAERFLLRQGGSQRDPYNLGRATADSKYVASLGRALGGRRLPQYTREMSLSLLHRETLHGLLDEAEYFYSNLHLRGDLTHPALLTRIAQIEVALAVAIETRLTPAQVVRDVTPKNFDPMSPTGRFLSSFLDPNTVMWEAYFSSSHSP